MSGTTTPAATGSVTDMLARLKSVLPQQWFPDSTPILDGLLTGLATTAATLWTMLAYVRLQTRLATCTDSFVDLAAADYCGTRVVRRTGETDAVFRARIERELFRPRATRAALVQQLEDLTGRVPAVFEPSRPADVGGAWGYQLGYGTAGAWGSLTMPNQVLVTAYRPFAASAPAWTGGSGPGAPAAGPTIQGQVTDTEIYQAIAAVTPIAGIAWTALSN